MASITFISHAGEPSSVELGEGNAMQAAVWNSIRGIDGDCGGVCACATCHVYVDPAWLQAVGTADETEVAMLELAEDVRPNSRLACQIAIKPELDGLILHLPMAQH